MPRIFKTNGSVGKAIAFKESLSTVDPVADNLYFFFGKSEEWTDENNPDTPTDSTATDILARQTMLGIKKIPYTNVMYVVPRYTWTSGTVYSKFDVDDGLIYDKNFYVVNSSNQVFKCIDNNSGAISDVEPIGTSVNEISTGDGYTWKFLYNLNTTLSNNFLTTSWLPVPDAANKTTFQTSVESNASYTSGECPGGHGSNPVYELGAKYLMIYISLENSESGVFSITDAFRQFGLWINPTDGTSTVSGTTYTVNDSNSSIDINSGRILYIDNRKFIQRSATQTETFQLILEF